MPICILPSGEMLPKTQIVSLLVALGYFVDP